MASIWLGNSLRRNRKKSRVVLVNGKILPEQFLSRTFAGKFWSSVKKTFTGETVIDELAQEHRDQFTSLIRELKNTFKPDNLLVSLTVLPNVNSTG